MSIAVLEARTVGEAWLQVSRAILERGAAAAYDGQPTREIALLTLTVEAPASDDPLVTELGDADWLAWMHENFVGRDDIPELGHARSYGARLFDYAGSGRDQVEWVVERLRDDAGARSAALTTFEPLTDDSYVPCVSMLDFWIPQGALELVVYAHSLDFGKKAYGNLVELARLQEHVATAVEVEVGRLVVQVKSAHIYEAEWALMARLSGAALPVG